MLDRYAIFSTHAKERLKECQLSMAKANWLIYTGNEEKLPEDLNKAKNEKYSDKALYIRNGSLLFTLLPLVDKFSGEDIYLIVSVYDQRMDL